MLIVHVHIRVKPEVIPAFIEATCANARLPAGTPASPSSTQFQQQDDPTRFVLVEVYRNPGLPGKHKETPHYAAAWRDAVAPWMAREPRFSVRFNAVFPPPEKG